MVDMTDHWKVLEEHFLMISGGKILFLNFSQKTSSVKSKHTISIQS
jgi:hypothetical protein